MNPQSIIPVRDRIIVKPDAKETRTKAGIFLPDNARDESGQGVASGVVVATGPGVPQVVGGELRPGRMSCAAGDKILYNPYGAARMKCSTEELILLSDDDVIAIIAGHEGEKAGANG